MTEPLHMPVTGKIAAPGLYDLTDLQYHGDCCDGPSISSSGLKVIADDPSEYWRTSYLNPDRDPPPEKACWNIGKAAHWLLLEPDVFRSRVVEIPEAALSKSGSVGTGAARAIIAEANAANCVAVKPAEWQMIHDMRDALARKDMVRKALRKGIAEPSLIWRDAETGVWLKTKPDYMPTRSGLFLVDYKTTDLKTPEDWMRKSVIDNGLAMQAAMQMLGAKVVSGIEPCGVLYIVQSKAAPYRVMCRTLSLKDDENRSELMLARLHLRHAIDTFARGIATGNWPSPWDEAGPIRTPGWHVRDVAVSLENAEFTMEDDYGV